MATLIASKTNLLLNIIMPTVGVLLDTQSASHTNSISCAGTTLSPSSGLYSVVWRWHFYAGLLTTPILWLVVLTGCLYVFRTELSAWRDRSLQIVVPSAPRVSYDELYKTATASLAGEKPEALIVHPEPNRSIRFVGHVEAKDGTERHQHVYLNPYNGQVLGSRIEEEDFFAIVLDLHRSLMLGNTGRILTELVTSWGLILLGTGLYLWWPRGKKNVGVWIPRVRGKLYAVLRDWHAVCGFYLLPLMALVMFTGLFFTLVWGTGYNNTAKKMGHWPPQWFAIPKSPAPTPGTPPASLDRVVATFLSRSRPNDAVAIRLAASSNIAHKAFMMRDEDKNSLRMMTVNQYTSDPIAVIDVAQLPLMYRIRVWSVSIHMGQIFGTPTKILALLTSLGVLAMSVTGVWMWWRRRPTGSTGFPRRPHPGSLPLWGWGVILLSAILLPVAGLSFLLIGLIDCGRSQIRRRFTT